MVNIGCGLAALRASRLGGSFAFATAAPLLAIDADGGPPQDSPVMLRHPSTRFGIVFALLTAVSVALAADVSAPAPPKTGVQITRLADRLRVEINGQLFTEYFFQDVPRPYCYPLIGPGDVARRRCSWTSFSSASLRRLISSKTVAKRPGWGRKARTRRWRPKAAE